MSYVSTGLHRAVTIQRLTGSRNNAMSYVNIASRIIRSSPLFDRSELVCRRWGGKKFLAGTHPQACVSSRKFGEKTAKLHRLRELPSRGPSALVLYTQNTRRTQKSTFPDLPERVWTADAGHTTQPPAEKTQIYLTYL